MAFCYLKVNVSPMLDQARCLRGLGEGFTAGAGRILLENYYLQGELEAAITAFIKHNNHRRYQERDQNLAACSNSFDDGQDDH